MPGDQKEDDARSLVFDSQTLPTGFDILGAPVDQASASLEFWVKPNAGALTQNNTLFETGGGTGTGVIIDSNQVLRAANGIDVGPVSYDLATDPLGVLESVSPQT